MAFDPLTAVLNIGNTLIDRLLPDKAANDAAKLQLLNLQVTGEFQNMAAQLQVDSVEATNQNVFVAGWRPFIGWVCGSAFAYTYILHPITITLLVAFKVQFDASKLPVLNMSDMMPVLLGMLGLGAMRSFDKANGVGNGH
jgi:hypothetical protein